MKAIERLLESILAACEVAQTTNGRGWWSQYISEIPQLLAELEKQPEPTSDAVEILCKRYGTSLAKIALDLEAKNEELKERIEFAVDYLPESPNKALGFLEPALKEQGE